MMTAWEILTAGSTIDTGTAWEHLNAQGGGGAETLILADGLDMEIEMGEIEVEVDTQPVEVLVDNDQISIEIDTSSREVEI